MFVFSSDIYNVGGNCMEFKSRKSGTTALNDLISLIMNALHGSAFHPPKRFLVFDVFGFFFQNESVNYFACLMKQNIFQ